MSTSVLDRQRLLDWLETETAKILTRTQHPLVLDPEHIEHYERTIGAETFLLGLLRAHYRKEEYAAQRGPEGYEAAEAQVVLNAIQEAELNSTRPPPSHVLDALKATDETVMLRRMRYAETRRHRHTVEAMLEALDQNGSLLPGLQGRHNRRMDNHH